MATHSSVLAWRIPGAEESGGLPSMRSHRVGHDWSDLAAAAATSHFMQYIIPFLLFLTCVSVLLWLPLFALPLENLSYLLQWFQLTYHFLQEVFPNPTPDWSCVPLSLPCFHWCTCHSYCNLSDLSVPTNRQCVPWGQRLWFIHWCSQVLGLVNLIYARHSKIKGHWENEWIGKPGKTRRDTANMVNVSVFSKFTMVYISHIYLYILWMEIQKYVKYMY